MTAILKPSLYMAYMVRGEGGDNVDRGIMQDNLEYGRWLGRGFRRVLPECNIYVPHERQNEDVMQAAWTNTNERYACGSGGILAHSGDIVRACTAGILVCCSVTESAGVAYEVMVAHAVGIPVFYLAEHFNAPVSDDQDMNNAGRVVRVGLQLAA